MDAEKCIFLTFDDGPDPRYTGKLLDLLKKEDVKATFFVVGENGEENPDLLKRMIEEGHIVGCHTYSHRNALLMTKKMSDNDMKRCMAMQKNILGEPPKYFRPPWGIRNFFTKRQAKNNGMKLVLWDVMAEDWKKDASVESISEKLRSRVFDGSIICLHDAGENTGGAKGAPLKTIEALSIVIPELKDLGYKFCLADKLEV